MLYSGFLAKYHIHGTVLMVLKGELNGEYSALNLDVLKKTLYTNVGLFFCIDMAGPSTLCFQCAYCTGNILIRTICKLPPL